MNAATATRPQSRLGGWFDHHVYSLVASVGRMLGKPWATALTVGVMSVALALPLGLWAALVNVESLAGQVQQARQVSVFLKTGVSAERATALADELRARGDVAAVELRTPEQGLAELRERAGLGEAIEALEDNPLPSLLLVTPRQDELRLATALQALAEADQVQHDAGWRERLDGWLRFGLRLAMVLAALLGLGALLVVGNTVRLDIQARREEIGVLQLLGATDGFIRRPFLYLGACYGLAAGALALGLLSAANLALRAPLAELAGSYGSHFVLQGFDPLQALAFVFATAVLGWLGAGLVTGHYLRQTRPTAT
ncbi:permease-like cell division protein FtsX [Montanilutibacter psychrotolerans]|uniref:Cell division protein FtsX n=1 Tax=Montanilutibacter psychrotolerans TaxID=1327343 RepID=A0A3M8SMA0_9GAMM|nr:permease-like cell division protein FtsX [Lysobacter psychrotolerans]RNF82349.1 ABC transporter permease [Lysobacter psychrotolerans]